MKHLFYCLALVAGFFGSLFSQNIEFEKLNGPYGGGFPISAGKPGVLFQIYNSFYIYRSLDDGTTWTEIPKPPLNVYLHSAVVGADGNLYCSDGTYLYKSSDDGDSWQVLAPHSGSSIEKLFALPDGTLFWGTGVQLNRSTDNGQTWTNFPGLDVSGGFAYDATTGDLFAWPDNVPNGMTGELLRSTDNGDTWATVFIEPNCHDLILAFAPNGTVFAGGEGHLWKSTDNCVTWGEVDLNQQNSGYLMTVAVSKSGRVFAHEWGEAVYSDDDGTTWQQLGDNFIEELTGFFASPSGKVFATRGAYSYSLYASADDGANWIFSATGVPFPWTRQLLHIDGSNFLAVTEDGVWHSNDGGAKWVLSFTIIGDNLVFSTNSIVAATGPDTWFAYDGLESIVKITDGGATQTVLSSPFISSSDFIGIWASKLTKRIFLSLWDGFYTSDDEGQTWVFNGIVRPEEMLFMPDGKILIPYYYDDLLKSEDNGDSWSVLATKFFNDLRLGEDGSLIQSRHDHFSKSMDGGLTWDSIPLPPDLAFNFFGATSNNIGQIFAYDDWSSTILRSIDGGLSFNAVGGTNYGYGTEPKLSFDPAQHLFITTEGSGIYRSKLPTSQTKILSGSTFFDKNKNCDRDLPTDTTLTRRLVKATKGSQTVYGYVNAAGKFLLPMEPGDWTAEAIPPSDYWQSCAEAVNIPNSPTIGIVDSAAIGLKAVVDCPLPGIEISAPFLRRCFESTIFAQFKNTGTAPAIGAKLTITLDPLLDFNSASLPVFSQNGQAFTFSLGDLPIGSTGSMTMKVTPNCSAPLGQVHCVAAHISPDVLCPPTFGAKVLTSATCTGDSLHLLISNIGQTAIAAPLNWSVAGQDWNSPGSWASDANGQFQLAAGGQKTIAIAADGSKNYTFSAQQSPDFPFNVVSTTTVRGCGAGANLPLNIVNDDDDGPFDDHFCQPNIGAFDPNDKQGFPIGLGGAGHIEREQKLEYLIRFQNTGSDTAFNISIRDTLPTTLDPATLVLGPSSHPCRLQMMPDGSAMFLFEHIMLPDSNIDEAASHGFVQYSISQKTGNPIGTKIENRAGIYFDFNEPVLTNFTLHTVGIPQVSGTNPPVLFEKNAVRFSPNPFTDAAQLIFTKKIADGQEFLFEMHDLLGRKVRSEMVAGPRAVVLRGGLPAGLYHFSVKTRDGLLVGSGPVSVQ